VQTEEKKMLTVSMPEMKDAVRHVAVRKRHPIMIWGKPGIGKSEGIKQVAFEFGATIENNCFVDIRLSQYDSVDLRGIPVPHADATTVWNMPATIPFKGNPKFDETAKVIFLFLDELNSGATGVLAACYQLINDRRVGEHDLMDNVIIIGAGNRETDRGVTTRMPTPIANRLTHYELQEDVDAVCIHFQSLKLPNVGIAFLQFRKPLLSTFDPAKPDKAFATPRTWQKAFDYYSDKEMPDALKQASMAGAVGQGPSAEFWGFVDVWHKVIPVSKIIADPHGAKLPDEASMRYATAVNVSGELTTKNVAPLHTYLKRMEPTYLILAWHLAIKRDKTLFGTSQFLELAKDYKAVFS